MNLNVETLVQPAHEHGVAMDLDLPSHGVDSRRLRILGLVLCGVLVSAGISTSHLTANNNRLIFFHEMAFIVLSMLLLNGLPPFVRLARTHRLEAWCLGLWAVSVSIALYVSPYRVAWQPLGISRYLETLAHVLFALFVWDFFRRTESRKVFVAVAIPVSAIYVAIVFIALLNEWPLDMNSLRAASRFWRRSPPLNANIRHTGYHAAAALVTTLAFMAWAYHRYARRIGYYGAVIVSLALWTFVFWLGGRGAMLAALITLGLIMWSLHRHGIRRAPFFAIAIAVAIIGAVLAEWLAVFPWNGLLHSIRRTLLEPDPDRVSSGRISLWLRTLEQVRQYPVFGMGPNGYRFMPGRGRSVQPHCMVIQFLAEWGLAGTIPFLIVIGRSIGTVFHRLIVAPTGSLDARLMVGGSLICALTVLGLIDGTYYHGQPSIYLALAFGMALSAAPTAKPTHPE